MSESMERIFTSTFVFGSLGRVLRATFLSLLFVITIFASSGSAQGLLEDVDPSAKIRQVIEAMEASLSNLMTEFGDTLDEQTLLALQRATAGLQSAKLAAQDVMEETFENVSKERRAVIADAHAMMSRIEDTLQARTEDFAEIEQRFSKTLEDVARVTGEPWILSYGPLVFIPSLGGDVRIRIEGKHLDHAANRLLVGGREIAPSASLGNRVDFSVPRHLLDSGDNGFASFRLRLNHDKAPGWRFWRSKETIAREVTLDLRSAGGTLGRYVLETMLSTAPSWATETVRISKTSPVNEEHCLNPPEGGVFDTAYTELRIVRNRSHRAAHTIPMFDGFPPRLRNVSIRAAWVDGPSNAARRTLNTPERICVTFNSPANPGGHIDQTQVVVDLVVRQRTPGGERPYSTEGEIAWAGGDHVEVLPPGHQGFRATVRFTAGGNDAPRVFTREETYKFLKVLFDSASRTLTFRPVPE